MMNLQSLQRKTFWVILVCMIGMTGCDGTVNDAGPDVPKLIYPNDGSEEKNATELQWNTAAGASFYHVQVATSSSFTELSREDQRVTSNAFPMSSLEVGKEYFWRIRSGNDMGFGEWTKTRSFFTEKEGFIPPIPILASPGDGTLDHPTQINFEWAKVEGATTYHIQVSLEENFIRRSADVEGVRGTTTLIRGLVPTYIYYWRVRSQNPLGFSQWSPTRYLVIEDDL